MFFFLLAFVSLRTSMNTRVMQIRALETLGWGTSASAATGGHICIRSHGSASMLIGRRDPLPALAPTRRGILACKSCYLYPSQGLPLPVAVINIGFPRQKDKTEIWAATHLGHITGNTSVSLLTPFYCVRILLSISTRDLQDLWIIKRYKASSRLWLRLKPETD